MTYFNAYVRSRLCYGSNTWNTTKRQTTRLGGAHTRLLRKLVRNGNKQNEDFSYVYSNEDILKITRSIPVVEYLDWQQQKWYAHCVRSDNDRFIKQLFYESGKGGRTSQALKQKVERRMERDELQLIKMAQSREF